MMRLAFALLLVTTWLPTVRAVDPYGPKDAKLTVLVMDPMSAALACDCVQGYAQRRYESLADYLQDRLGQSVRVVWAESIENASQTPDWRSADLIIGKDSVVRFDVAKNKLNFEPIASLTDTNGSAMQRGLFVVSKGSPAASLLDIEGYRVFWGPEDCDEKSKMPKHTLKELEIKTAGDSVSSSCSVAAKDLLALPSDQKAVAVISSYAAPLLEGCGTVKKGDLRVIGQSEEVPFISVFVSKRLPENLQQAIQKSLLQMKSENMLRALETKSGFVSYVGMQKKR